MYLSHPLRITLRQIIVDSDDMHPFSFQRIQICRQQTGLRLTFTGLHLGNTPLMQNNSANQLYAVVFRIKNSPRRFSHRGICLRQQIIQSLPFGQSFFIFFCFITQLLVRQFHHLRTERFNLIDQSLDTFDFSFTMCSKHFLNYAHDFLISVYQIYAAKINAAKRLIYCIGYAVRFLHKSSSLYIKHQRIFYQIYKANSTEKNRRSISSAGLTHFY